MNRHAVIVASGWMMESCPPFPGLLVVCDTWHFTTQLGIFYSNTAYSINSSPCFTTFHQIFHVLPTFIIPSTSIHRVSPPCSHPIRCPIAQGTGLEADLPMLRVPEKVTNVGILMITGQRGWDDGAASSSGLPRSASSELKAWHFWGWTDKLMGKT